jgi:hypothetical protein
MSLRKYLSRVFFYTSFIAVDNCSSGLPVYALVDATNHGNELRS